MNAMINGNHTVRKFFNNPTDTFLARTVEDIFKDNFFDSFDANIHEEHDAYKLAVAVPGMTRHDITVTVEGDVLRVSGERRQRNDSLRAMEFNSTRLQRSFTLPTDADINKIEAKCRNGLLEISIGKMKSKQFHRVIPVHTEESVPVKTSSWWTRFVDKGKALLMRDHLYR